MVKSILLLSVLHVILSADSIIFLPGFNVGYDYNYLTKNHSYFFKTAINYGPHIDIRIDNKYGLQSDLSIGATWYKTINPDFGNIYIFDSTKLYTEAYYYNWNLSPYYLFPFKKTSFGISLGAGFIGWYEHGWDQGGYIGMECPSEEYIVKSIKAIYFVSYFIEYSIIKGIKGKADISFRYSPKHNVKYQVLNSCNEVLNTFKGPIYTFSGFKTSVYFYYNFRIK